jgi:hypothetical protein
MGIHDEPGGCFFHYRSAARDRERGQLYYQAFSKLFPRILGSRKMKPGDFGNATNLRQSVGLPIIAAVVVFCAPYQGVSAADNRPALTPNQDFSNSILQIHAPASDGWHGFARSASLIAFGKSGSSAGESFIAQVNLFHLPTFPDSEAFTEFVREAVIKDSPTDRFETLEVNVQYSATRGYPCVTYNAVSDDKKARVSILSRKTLRFEVFALYCQHPIKPGLGFSAVFSHRGGSIDQNLDKEAADFIDSIQVTPPSQAP